jgi:DNA-binding response OmpR family regulator
MFDEAVGSREMRILLVRGIAEPELARALARDGHDVLAVADDERPARLLRVFEPDVVLIAARDVPGACRELRRYAPELPIVAIVASRDLEARIAALSSGADDSLSSPVHPAELLARIHAVTRRSAPSAGHLQVAGEQPLDGAA